MIMAIYGQWLPFRAVSSATRFALENYFLINSKANGKQLDCSLIDLIYMCIENKERN